MAIIIKQMAKLIYEKNLTNLLYIVIFISHGLIYLFKHIKIITK